MATTTQEKKKTLILVCFVFFSWVLITDLGLSLYVSTIY